MASICCSPPDSVLPDCLSLSFSRGKQPKTSPAAPSQASGNYIEVFFDRQSGKDAAALRHITDTVPWHLVRRDAAELGAVEFHRAKLAPDKSHDGAQRRGLPAPLRPSNAAASPDLTSKLTPCRMCSLPICTCRSRRLSMGGLLYIVLVLRTAEIGFAHALVRGDFRGASGSKHATLRHQRFRKSKSRPPQPLSGSRLSARPLLATPHPIAGLAGRAKDHAGLDRVAPS